MGSRLATVLTVVLLALTSMAATPDGGGERVDVIVVLHDGADADRAASRAARDHAAEVSFVYRSALQGFAASVPAGRLHALERSANVDYVERDGTVSIAAQELPTGLPRVFADQAVAIDGADDGRAVDVDVAVIDTGIDFEHPDLTVVGGVTCAESGGGPPWMRTVQCDPGGDDDHYHGTHVAGTIGALDNDTGVVGIAPGARLHAVKVLDRNGSGSLSMVIAGIDWVAANAGTIEVANMSLGGGFSQAENDAVAGAVATGVAFAVAAGNSDADASNSSPASSPDALTVSALADFDGAPGGLGAPTCRTDQDDTLADFSNWGPAVDVAAPGVCILSTYPVDQGSYGTISGTSMASPHVAGALALLASTTATTDAAGVEQLYATVTTNGNFDWVDDSGDGILEPLLDLSGTTFAPTFTTGGGGGGGGGEEPPPPSGFTLSASGYKVKGVQHADLTWSGTSATSVDVYRDGSKVATTTNDGAYTDNIGNKGGGSYAYEVCEAGTSTCSNTVTVTF